MNATDVNLVNLLKPCPFCGSKAVLERGGFGEIFARCSNSNCGISFDCGIWFTTPQQAIDLWNKRVSCTPTPNCPVEQAKTATLTWQDIVEEAKVDSARKSASCIYKDHGCFATESYFDLKNQIKTLQKALKNAYGLIVGHHEYGFKQELGQFCPVCTKDAKIIKDFNEIADLAHPERVI